MSVVLVPRFTWTDDSGFGLDGTILDNSQLQAIFDAVDAALEQVVQVKSATYTVLSTDDLVKVPSGTFTLTLYTAVGFDGKQVDIVNPGTGVVTIDPNGAQTIGGQATWALGSKQAIRIKSDGANWVIVSLSNCEVWTEELTLPISFFRPHPVGGCGALEDVLMSTGRYAAACPFDATSIESAYCFYPLPRRWNLGTFTFEPYGFNTAGHPPLPAPPGFVVLQMAAVAMGNNESKDVDVGTFQTSIDTIESAKDQAIGPISNPITIAGSPAVNDGIRFVLQRDPTALLDEYGSDYYVEAVKLRLTMIAFNDNL
jgi:hypothetical protein